MNNFNSFNIFIPHLENYNIDLLSLTKRTCLKKFDFSIKAKNENKFLAIRKSTEIETEIEIEIEIETETFPLIVLITERARHLINSSKITPKLISFFLEKDEREILRIKRLTLLRRFFSSFNFTYKNYICKIFNLKLTIYRILEIAIKKLKKLIKKLLNTKEFHPPPLTKEKSITNRSLAYTSRFYSTPKPYDKDALLKNNRLIFSS